MEGRILGDRYELVEKIGGGGMALVYKAKCRLLNRYVAVKILRPEFANDEEFVKRFRVEAQSAASLSHPNIVSIYDVGQNEDLHYIIMEFVDGITLKQYITQKGALSWKEATNISIQICSAIENAHRNHIVHRDIKPHNILLTRDGIAKVTDFGIARAVSSSTITMVGSTIGSVHYFSPEQARGGFIDEKSDLYSLGITMYEMVTGRVPFDGETPVAIALKHIQEQASNPINIKPELPQGVNDIIVKGIMKDPNQRYQTATEFLDDLYKVLKEPHGEFVVKNDFENSPTRRVQAIGSDNLKKKEEYLIREKEEDKVTKEKKKDKLTYWLAGISAVIIMLVLGVIAYRILSPADTKIVLDSYVGRNIDDVRAELDRQGFKDIKVIEEASEKVEKGRIISQSPNAGVTLKPDGYSPIELKVSTGPQYIKIRETRGEDPRQVAKDFRESGLKVKEESEYDETIAAGRVTRTFPGADAELKLNDTVTVYVSKGPEIKMTKVPNLVGLTQTEAMRKLFEAKLVIGNTFPENGSNLVDKIIDQKPMAFTEVKQESAVDIYLDVKQEPKVKEQPLSISLPNPESYGDRVNVVVEVIPSDTKAPNKIFEGEKAKQEFPFNVMIPVPEGGTSKVRIYIDGALPYGELEFK